MACRHLVNKWIPCFTRSEKLSLEITMHSPTATCTKFWIKFFDLLILEFFWSITIIIFVVTTASTTTTTTVFIIIVIIITISSGNWTEWSTIQGVIGRVILNHPNA